jgi:alkylation response protein AidB-like acyl-CoA dehydrogenase
VGGRSAEHSYARPLRRAHVHREFDQPIATFQAVAQRAADAFIDTEAVRLTALQAAWRIDAGLPADAAVPAASRV